MTARRRKALAAGLATVFSAASDCGAVSLSQDGTGQALIYPYYSVQSAQGNSFNTYLSVVNHTDRAKALRIRFREGRNSREVMSFNLFLSPNDVWTSAVVPRSAGGAAYLITADTSCTSRGASIEVANGGLDFSNALYSGANDDGSGTGLDRTREGFVEMIEMGTLTGSWAAAVTHTSTSQPSNCGVVQGSTLPQVKPPTGGLSGTLTLINVNSGLDFGVSAEALADLSTQPFYRPATDPYPDFNAAEIIPVSAVAANGNFYRSSWTRPVDAVSAVLMRSEWLAEYALEPETASLTDIVLTFPTRQFYTTSSSFSPPFSAPAGWDPSCITNGGTPARGEQVRFIAYDRNQRQETLDGGCLFICELGHHFNTLCAASTAISPTNGYPHMPSPANPPASSVLGAATTFRRSIVSTYTSGWLATAPTASTPLTSLPSSTRIDILTGQRTEGSHNFTGLPVLGFWARTFVNGTLTCSAGACQGNYGGAFPLKYRRAITP